jgi:hypothetical protein
LTITVVKVSPILAPVVPMLYESELLAAKRMEGMSDLERSCLKVTIGCIPRGTPTPTPNGG